MHANLETNQVEVDHTRKSNRVDMTKFDEKYKDFDKSKSEKWRAEISKMLEYLAKKDLESKEIYPESKRDPVELKNQGNIKFENRDYLEALNLYKLALDTATDKILIRNLFSNISECFINLRLYDDAIDYANSSLEIDPNF